MTTKDFKLAMLLLRWEYNEIRSISSWTKGDKKITCVAGKHPLVMHLHLDWNEPNKMPIVFHCFDSLYDYIYNWRV